MYKCVRCGKEFDELPKGLIRCPNCAYRILTKKRPPVTRTVQAR